MKDRTQWSLPLRYLVLVLLILLSLLAFWYVRSILQPLIIAAFLAYLINPGVNFLVGRGRMTRSLAVNLVYFVSLGLLIGLPSSLTPIFFDEFKKVLSDLLDLYNQLIIWLMQPHIIPNLPIDLTQLANRLVEFRSTFLSSLTDQTLQLIESTSLGALWFVFILVAVYYFLAEWPRLRQGLISSFPETYQPELNELYRRIRRVWLNYMRGQLLLMLIVGVIFTMAWTILGIPGALVLGVIAGFLTLIPDVGPLIAVLLAAGVALLEGSTWVPWPNLVVVLATLVVYVFLVAVKNFWLRPVIMGRSVHMNEALVFISIILATFLWGILGALLVVPGLASVWVILQYLQRKLLGQPAFPEGSLASEADPDLPILEPVEAAHHRKAKEP